MPAKAEEGDGDASGRPHREVQAARQETQANPEDMLLATFECLCEYRTYAQIAAQRFPLAPACYDAQIRLSASSRGGWAAPARLCNSRAFPTFARREC